MSSTCPVHDDAYERWYIGPVGCVCVSCPIAVDELYFMGIMIMYVYYRFGYYSFIYGYISSY